MVSVPLSGLTSVKNIPLFETHYGAPIELPSPYRG